MRPVLPAIPGQRNETLQRSIRVLKLADLILVFNTIPVANLGAPFEGSPEFGSKSYGTGGRGFESEATAPRLLGISAKPVISDGNAGQQTGQHAPHRSRRFERRIVCETYVTRRRLYLQDGAARSNHYADRPLPNQQVTQNEHSPLRWRETPSTGEVLHMIRQSVIGNRTCNVMTRTTSVALISVGP